MKTFTKTLMRLNSELPNRNYDRRCKYGLGAHAVFPAGMLWIKRLPAPEMIRDEWVPENLTPEQQEEFRERIRERHVRHSTPLGTVLDPDDIFELKKLSTPDKARSVEELLFVHDMGVLSPVDIFKHLMRAHDWTLTEVERVVAGLAQEGSDEMGA